MNTKYLVVHTYLDLQATKEKNRPVWRSLGEKFPGLSFAHEKMREAFCNYFHSFAASICAASFNHDCAYIELENGTREIWTIIEMEG